MKIRLSFIVTILLVLAATCHGQVTFVQKAQVSGPTAGFTLGSNSTAHNAYAMGVLDQAGASSVIQTPTDNNGNTWHLVGSQIQVIGFTNWGIRMAYTCDISVATHNPVTITVPFSSGTSGDAVLIEMAGTATGSSTACLDNNAGQSISDTGAANTVFGSGSITTNTTATGSGAVGLSADFIQGTYSLGSGWTTTGSSGCLSAFICGEYQVGVAANTSLQATWTVNSAHDSVVAQMVVLKGPVAASPIVPRHRGMVFGFIFCPSIWRRKEILELA